ncbi:MAG: hypothetical protein J5449_12010, partial [Oscillospiraceae bacterium]|nr:hypothetical protein [Oscillospiraceae bacterium]
MRNTVNYGSPGDRWGRAEKNSKGESCTKENNYKREGNDKSKYSGLDFEEVWVMTENGPRPRNVGHLAHDGVVKISSVDELRLFRDKVNHGVDFGGVTVLLTKDLNLANEDDWLPIGHTTRTPSKEDPMAYFDDPVFAGVFDGGGHRIRGLKCIESDRNGAGLFGKVTGKVCNLQVIGSVTGHAWVGGVVGVLHGGTVTNCSFEGNVTGQYDVGGVVGLCDWYENHAQVTISLFQGNVTATGAIEGRGAGGIIGRLSGGAAEQCAVLGGTVSSAKNAGGVVGYMEKGDGLSLVSNCSHLGDVNGTAGAGGVVGAMKDASVLSCCYHYTGNVTGSLYVGGVVGMPATGDDSVSPYHCYYLSGTATVGDKTTGGIGTLTKGLDVPNVAQALTMAQFRSQSSFSTWWILNTWTMGETRPILAGLNSTVTFIANGGLGRMGAYTLPSGGGTLPKCSFTAPDGMEFIGWNTSPRANGDWYEDGAYIGGRQKLQLYAVWAKRQNVQYVDTTYGDAVETANCLTLNDKLAQLSDGWYCVEGSVQLGTRLEIVGDVNLILMDGASMTVEKGIRVPNDSTLTIWGQEGMHEVHEKTSALTPTPTPTLTLTRGTGKLTVSNQSSDDDTANNAAIGGNYGESTGLIRINGGVISAHASGHGAPIGGACCEGGGSIIISGGCVDAVSTGGGAGIGGGTNGSGGSVTISGGYVNAVGGSLRIVDQNILPQTMKAPGIGAGAPDHLDGKGAKTAGPVVNISGAYVRADAGSRQMELNPVKAQPIGTSYSTSYNTDWITSIGVEVYADGEKILHDGLGEAVNACDVLEFRPCEGHICCNDDPNHCRWCNARIAAIRGKGTFEEPWELTNTAQWDLLAAYMRSGFDLDSKCIDLMNDILVTTRLGTRENLFGGYFYGNGHTIVFALDGEPQAHDPFVCARTWGPSNTNIVVIKPGGAVIGYNAKDGGLNAAISLPEGYDGSAVLLLLAEYDKANRCTDVRTFRVTADMSVVRTGVLPKQDRTYRLMLVDAKTYAPLCAAWNT